MKFVLDIQHLCAEQNPAQVQAIVDQELSEFLHKRFVVQCRSQSSTLSVRLARKDESLDRFPQRWERLWFKHDRGMLVFLTHESCPWDECPPWFLLGKMLACRVLSVETKQQLLPSAPSILHQAERCIVPPNSPNVTLSPVVHEAPSVEEDPLDLNGMEEEPAAVPQMTRFGSMFHAFSSIPTVLEKKAIQFVERLRQTEYPLVETKESLAPELPQPKAP